MLTCIKCGDNVEGKSFCSNCGERVEEKIFCTNCGNCVTGENFCGTCGVAVGTPQPYPYSQEYYGNAAGFVSGPPTKKSLSTKSKIIIGAAGFVVLAAIIVVVIVLSGGTTERPLSVQELLEVAERYLLEGNYEQALVEFIRVIEVDPMEPRGYTGAAEAYVELDRIDDALDVLHQGLGVLPDNPEILSMIDVVEEVRARYIPGYDISRIVTLTQRFAPESELWREAYAEFLRTYPLDEAYPIFMLLDLNNNGIPELFTLHNRGARFASFNIYTFDNAAGTILYIDEIYFRGDGVISVNPDFPGIFLFHTILGVDSHYDYTYFMTMSNNEIEVYDVYTRIYPFGSIDFEKEIVNQALYDVFLASVYDRESRTPKLLLESHERTEANIQNVILGGAAVSGVITIPDLPTLATVTENINGIPREFDVYKINGINYFNIQDFVDAFRGTENQFFVDMWISIPPNELETVEWTVGVDGVVEWIVTSFYIEGNHYFRLFDIHSMLNSVNVFTDPPSLQQPNEPIITPDMQSALIAYREFLLQEQSVTIGVHVERWNMDHIQHVELVDFDNDGVPELIVITRPPEWDVTGHWGQAWAGSLITIWGYTGEVKLLFEGIIWGEGGQSENYELAIHIDGRTYLVTVFSELMATSDRDYFALINGEFVSRMARHTPLDTGAVSFHVNGSPVSEAEFNDTRANYGFVETREIWNFGLRDVPFDVQAFLATLNG